MEPLTLAATAIAATIMTKFWEKTGEQLSEKLFSASDKFLKSLKKKSPETVTAIEQAPQQPLDYGKAVIDVEVLSRTDAELQSTIKELAAAAAAEQNPELDALVKEVSQNIDPQETPEQKIAKLADTIQKVGMVTINSPVSIQNFHMD
ncbi:MAG: hypothetical protein ACTS2F_29205 [Thainema sp.]